MEFRVGQGYDVHRLVENRKLILCGVDIPYERGLDGHSDADVAVHALIDALLGAASLEDIGQWFPDSDPAYAGADSMRLLENVMKSPRFSSYGIVNADVTLIAQAPKLGPWRETMRSNLADKLCVALDQVSVKFTTTEKLGFTGRGEGIAAEAVVLIKKLF